MKRALSLAVVCLLCASFAMAAPKESAQPEAKKGRLVEVAGVVVEVDAVTGRMRPLDADERQKLLLGLDKFLSRPMNGLRVEKNSVTGETSMDVSDHFQHVFISYIEDGEIRSMCTEDLNQALAVLFPADSAVSAPKGPKGPAKRETE